MENTSITYLFNLIKDGDTDDGDTEDGDTEEDGNSYAFFLSLSLSL